MDNVIGRGAPKWLRALVVSTAIVVGGASANAAVVDTLIGTQDGGSSGDPTELANLANFIDGAGGIQASDLTILSKVDRTIQVDTSFDPDQYFINVSPETPSYFILKFGGGNTGGPGTPLPHDAYYFANIGELNLLVFTLAQLGAAGSTTLAGLNGVLSHVTSVVPLPGAVILFGSALAGLGWLRRRQRVEPVEAVVA